MAPATAKQILYHPPLALLPKRKDTTPIPTTTTTHHPHHHPRGSSTLTVNMPFSFSTRLSRLGASTRGLQSASTDSIRRAAGGSRPRPGPVKSSSITNIPRAASLPRLGPGRQGLAAHVTATPRSGFSRRQSQPTTPLPARRPSNKTSRSTTTPYTGSEARRTSSGYGAEEASLEENNGEDGEEGVEEGDRGVVHHQQDDVEGSEAEGWVDREVVLCAEERRERRQNEGKCQRWLQGLPDRFSSMHVVQHVVYNGGGK